MIYQEQMGFTPNVREISAYQINKYDTLMHWKNTNHLNTCRKKNTFDKTQYVSL